MFTPGHKAYTYKSTTDADGEVWNVFTQDRVQAGYNTSFVWLFVYFSVISYYVSITVSECSSCCVGGFYCVLLIQTIILFWLSLVIRLPTRDFVLDNYVFSPFECKIHSESMVMHNRLRRTQFFAVKLLLKCDDPVRSGRRINVFRSYKHALRYLFQVWHFRATLKSNPYYRETHRQLAERRKAGRDIKVSFFGPVPKISENPHLFYH